MNRFRRVLGIFVLIGALVSCQKSTPVITLHAGDVIVAEGDSLTYGLDASATGHAVNAPLNGAIEPRSAAPYPETLQHLLNDKVTVENRGVPGAQAADGLAQWGGAKSGALAILMYGTNDCWNFGDHPSGRVSVEDFTAAMKLVIEHYRKGGSKIVLLTPPPLQDKEKDADLAPYREAVIRLAIQNSALLLDTPQTLKTISPTWTDGVHLTPESNRTLATALAAQIRVE